MDYKFHLIVTVLLSFFFMACLLKKAVIKRMKALFVVVCCALTCLPALSEGISFSWSVPFLPKITRDKENYDISEEQVVLFQVIPCITAIIACPVFSKVSDLIGRKKTLLLIVFPEFLTWILMATGRNVYTFYVARGSYGISASIMFAAIPSYIGEISTPNVRGTWGNAITVFFYTGQLLVTVVGSYFSIIVSSYIFLLIPITFASIFSFMPESPVFYLMKGRYKEAKYSLGRLRGKYDITADFVALKVDVERQMSETGTWRDLFVIKNNRRALIAMMFLRLAQAYSGAAMFVIYSGYIFEKSDSSLTPEISSIIYMSLHLGLSFCASFVVDILGRRRSLLYSFVPCGVILFIESIYFYIDGKVAHIDISFLNWLPITGLILFCTFCAFGIDIVPTIMLGELFSPTIKAKGIGLCVAFYGLVLAISNQVFYLLSSNFGMFTPFLLFACCNVISAILSFYIIPETKGKTLEEIQQDLKKPAWSIKDNENIYEECNQNVL